MLFGHIIFCIYFISSILGLTLCSTQSNSFLGMGKWAKYPKHYSKAWETEDGLKHWIQRVPNDDQIARCTFCDRTVRAHHSDLVDHAKTKKHIAAHNAISTQSKTLADFGVKTIVVDNTARIIELKLAAHIAVHSSILTIDHLGELVRKLSDKDIAIHRTKCSALIKKVLGLCMFEELIEDVRGVPYSLIVDESTDIRTKKQLAIVVRYFSRKLGRIVTTFIGIVELAAGTADAIFAAIKQFLQANNIPITDCVGLGTDTCNAMVGVNHSLYTNFREVCPNIVLVKCVCHSIQLASCWALKVLPRNIEFLVSQTYCWFSNSTHRLATYSDLYEVINVGEEPLKILKLSGTRWLSIAPCVKRILDQFDVLKLHFGLMADEERCEAARLLLGQYSNHFTKLYMVFLLPYLDDLNRVNKLFQLESGSPVKLLTELMTLYCSILEATMHRSKFPTWRATMEYNTADVNNQLPINAMYFGKEFTVMLAGLGVDAASALDVKTRCREYLVALLTELRARLPENVDTLESLSALSPSVILSDQKLPLHKLSFLPLYTGDFGRLERQYNRLSSAHWERFDDQHTEEFWIAVSQHTDASGASDFYDLGLFALSLLSLPFSNAAVERVFSHMNNIKTKTRNRMKQPLLEALLHIRSYMARNRMCCHEFEPTKQMFACFNADMYKDCEPMPDEF